MIDLTCIDKATEEDKIRGIHHWAKLFKATTWEEIKMLTADNTFLEEAAETVYQLSAEEQIRMQCEAREDYYRQQRYIQHKLDRLAELESKEPQMLHNIAELERKTLCLNERNETLQKDNQALQENNQVLQQDNHSLQQDNHALQQDNHALLAANQSLSESTKKKDAEIARLKMLLANNQV